MRFVRRFRLVTLNCYALSDALDNTYMHLKSNDIYIANALAYKTVLSNNNIAHDVCSRKSEVSSLEDIGFDHILMNTRTYTKNITEKSILNVFKNNHST